MTFWGISLILIVRLGQNKKSKTEMKTKRLLLGTLIAGILTIIFGGKTFATAGNTAEISGGKTWNVCVDAGASYAGSDFVVNVAKTDFASQIVLGNGDCKSVEMAAGTYTASLSSTMGAGTVSYEIANDALTFNVANNLRKYLNTFGSIAYTVEGSGEEPQFELLFSMPGECQFNGNANVSGETCKDGDGNPLTNKKYIDTNVALFSEENAGRDFEIYFTLSDYASTQEKQGTLFNAKYENSSMYYPGFTIRTVNTDGGAMEITGRLGKDNTNADKANNSIVTADIKNKEVKIVRVGGMVSYSIDGGEMIPFQNYKNFSRYFNQTAVFGASMQTNGTPQRYYDGTIKDIRVYLKKVPVETTGSIEFQANGGTGSMATIEGIEVGTDVVLPMSTLSMNNANFTGWNTKSNGTVSAYADGATITINEPGKLKLYAQWEGTGIAVLDEGTAVNKKMKSLANSRNIDDYYYEDSKIKKIMTTDSLPDDFDESDRNSVISDANVSSLPIYAWFDNKDNDGDGKGDGILYVYTIAAGIYGGTDMSHMFTYEKSLKDISALADWNTSGVTDMRGMFYGSIALSDISALADWNTSGVTWMGGMFRRMSSLSDISALANWNTANVTDMSLLFCNDTSLSDISALADWNTSGVTNMRSIFNGMTSLANISALANWNTSSVTNMSGMFSGDSSLSNISALAYWNTSSVTDMEDMFSRTIITNVDALRKKQHEGKDYVSWNTANVTNMKSMFSNASVLANVSGLADWNTSSVTNMSDMFYMNYALANISGLADWNTLSVTDMSSMFTFDESLTNISALSNWKTTNVTNMSNMFAQVSALTNVTALADWNTANVTDMGSMFSGMDALRNVSGLANWNTANVTDMGWLFRSDKSLSDISGLANWDTSRVTDMSLMFQWNQSLSNISALANWNTSSATDMRSMFSLSAISNISALANWNTANVTDMSSMFYNTKITNTDALRTEQHAGKSYVSWNTASVTNMSDMFSSTRSLTDISALASWNTSSVTDMRSMFSTSSTLSDISWLAGWNTSSVTDMSSMFAFDPSLTDVSALAGWNISSVKNMSYMFSYMSSLTDISGLANWNTSSVTNMSYMFAYDSSLTDVSALADWNTSSVTNMSYMFSDTPADPRPSWYH